MGRLALLVVLVLGGCAAEGPSLETMRVARVAPTSYRAELIAYLRNFLNDPTGVRNAYVSEPTIGLFQGEERYFSCVRFDARLNSGRYRGARDHLAVYFGGKLEYFMELRGGEGGDERCRSADYVPFPEIEQLTRR